LPQNADIPAVAVALTPLSRRVPEVFEHDVPEVNVVALPQASLPGCAAEMKGNNKKINDLFIILSMVRVFIEWALTNPISFSECGREVK
jgi:hypothetical protein